MKEEKIRELLEKYKRDEIETEDLIRDIRDISYGDLGYARIDNNRERRNGYPEVIYCQGKSLEHINGIVQHMIERGNINILGTRASREVYESLKKVTHDIVYDELAKIVIVNKREVEKTSTSILVVTGGTADLSVAEEAAITAELFGNKVERLYDVGVAGIHRLLDNTEKLRDANVVIAVAGMEGALPSVVGGLVDKPVIAVPTSVGYGANFDGLAPLLTMLNSCASGIGVVNIDNGFGAAYLASIINKMSKGA